MGIGDGETCKIVVGKQLYLLASSAEILEFCRGHRMHISTSLDGPEDLHNQEQTATGPRQPPEFTNGAKKARGDSATTRFSAVMTLPRPVCRGRGKAWTRASNTNSTAYFWAARALWLRHQDEEL